jgi:hypothetical protein
MTSEKRKFSSRQPKLEPEKKGGFIRKEKSLYEIAVKQVRKDLKPMKEIIFESILLDSNDLIYCECGEKMEFYGVDGNGGLKFNCLMCYKKQVIRNT